jgi:hypothetical protein
MVVLNSYSVDNNIQLNLYSWNRTHILIAVRRSTSNYPTSEPPAPSKSFHYSVISIIIIWWTTTVQTFY